MIIKTQAIALSIHPFSETSRIVIWLTLEHGKMATIIKGAQRPRNFFLGQYDLFYTCELLFYLRLFQGLHIVKECYPLKERSAFRTYWPGTACASYFTGLTAKASPFYAPQRSIYALLETALDFFAGENNPTPSRSQENRGHAGLARHGGQALHVGLFWFELKLLGIMGFAPRLNNCLQCHQPLTEAHKFAPTVFSAARGGVFCGRCAGPHRNDSLPIAQDVLALLRLWQSSKNIHAVRNVVCNERQLKETGRILGKFLQHHLETENTGREIALAILRQWNRFSHIGGKMLSRQPHVVA